MNPAPPVTSARIGAELSRHRVERASTIGPWPSRAESRSARRAARRGRAAPPRLDRRRRRREARASSGRRSPSSATTRRTRRCCSRRSPARRRARSPSGCASELERALGASAERIEVAGPGFLNLFLSDRWHREATAALLAAGDRLGAAGAGARRAGPGRVRERQPDRPGDRGERPRRRLRRLARARARARRARGRARVLRQRRRHPGAPVRRVGRGADARRASRPRTATRASTSASWPRSSAANGVEPGRPRRARSAAATEAMRDADRGDAWSASASTTTPGRRSARCATPGAVERALERAARRAATSTSSEGAVWLRTTEFGDDKDRVLIRADGEPTYFAPDIAYHLDKLERGHERLINVLGADHHGYVPRMRAALAALGDRPGAVRGADHAAGQHRRGRRAQADGQAHAATSSPSTS